MAPHPKPKKHKKKKRGVSPAKLKKVYGKVIDRDGTCQNPYCKKGWPLDPPHHIIKRSQGGEDIEINLVLTCIYCHDDIHKERLNVSGIAPDDLIWTIK